MIAALRRRHRAMTTALAIGLPLLYGAILLQHEPARPSAPVPAMDSVPRRPVGAALRLLDSPRLEAELMAAAGEAEPSALRVTPDGDPAIPDLLAYWAAAAPSDSEPPADAVLLGALRGSRRQDLVLPNAVRGKPGRLILYSMGWHRILGSVPLEGFR